MSGTKAYEQTSEKEKSVINNHIFHNATRFAVSVNEDQERLSTFYWLPKLHKKPYKARFIANSSSCTTTELSKLLTFCLTTIKNHVSKYCEKVYERSGKNLFWSIKNSCEVLNKLKSRGFRASSLSTYDFSTLYTTLPHNLIKDKLVDLIERTFQREGSLYIACNDRNAFFTSDAVRNYNLWSYQKVCEALTFLLDNIYIRFESKLYRQIVGIPISGVAYVTKICSRGHFFLIRVRIHQNNCLCRQSWKMVPANFFMAFSRSRSRSNELHYHFSPLLHSSPY